MTTGYEQDNGRIEVRFGDLDNQVIPLAWAETMLRDLFEQRPEHFGSLLSRCILAGRSDVKLPAIGSGRRASRG